MKRLAFSAIAVIAFFLLLEGGLRVAGLGRPAVVGTLRFGYRGGIPIHDEDGLEREGEVVDVPICEADPDLWWRPIADTPFTGADGLRRPVPDSRRKPPGTYRVAVIGDSCSFLGEKLYPTRFAELLSAHRAAPADVVNASCPGYTAFQGRRRLDEVWDWEPDLLVVWFGWNDHWRSVNGFTDAGLAARPEPAPVPALLRASRIYGVAAALLQPTVEPVDGSGPVRVPEEDYESSLIAIAASAEAHGCPVMFMTAPTAFIEGRVPLWAYAVFRQYYGMSRPQVSAIPRTHARYNAIVRSVANRAANATVVDLERLWLATPTSSRFRRDCIHLSERGHEDAAQALFHAWSAQRR